MSDESGGKAEKVEFGTVKAGLEAYIDFVAKYQGDPAFRSEVDRNPAEALRREGFEVPDGVEVRILETTEERLHILVPDASNR